jgi:hypothetical protein
MSSTAVIIVYRPTEAEEGESEVEMALAIIRPT